MSHRSVHLLQPIHQLLCDAAERLLSLSIQISKDAKSGSRCSTKEAVALYKENLMSASCRCDSGWYATWSTTNHYDVICLLYHTVHTPIPPALISSHFKYTHILATVRGCEMQMNCICLDTFWKLYHIQPLIIFRYLRVIDFIVVLHTASTRSL